jgi:hypothetical protein
MSDDQEYWYRYDDQRWSVTIDAEAEIYGTRLEVRESKYPVLRHTPKGVWVAEINDYRNPRFVLKDPRGKRLCYATREDALKGYIARKNRQITIYSARLRSAEEFRDMAQRKLSGSTII